MKSKKGFTLIELLVVVLIIGILAAIAVPQYQKTVMKAQLHKGIPLVESLYQAQQSYYLTHGEFAKNIDDLDITIPKNKSCTKYNSDCCSYYVCDFGKIGCWDKIRNTQFQDSTYTIAYLHLLEDIKHTSYNTTLYKGKRYCFARHKSKTAQEACQTMGGVYYADLTDNWLVYELK